MNKTEQLTQEQKELLDAFILKFLPKRGNKRKHSGNELDYVRTTLNRVFIQNYGFNLSLRDIVECFERLDYQIFHRDQDWDYKNDKMIPGQNVDRLSVETYPSNFYEGLVYFDIFPETIRKLMRTTAKLPNNSPKEMVEDTAKLKAELQDFAKK